MFTNASLTKTDIFWLNLFFQEMRKVGDCEWMIRQINESVIEKDITPYHHILDFYRDESKEMKNTILPTLGVQFLYTKDINPTDMVLTFDVSGVSSFEVYEADLGELNYEKISTGIPLIDSTAANDFEEILQRLKKADNGVLS